MKKSVGVLSAAGLGVTLILTGCSGSNDGDGNATAKKDPVVIACVPHDDYCNAMAQAFTEETGIPAQYVNLGAGETVARLEAAKSAPEFDVFWGGSAESHVAAYDAGLTEPYVAEGIDVIPEEFRDPEEVWTPVWTGILGFCSNERVLSDIGVEAPTSWDDLLAPELKSQVTMPHPGTSGSALSVFWTIYELKGQDEDATFDYFSKLHPNILQYPKSGAAPGQMVGRGEVAVGTSYVHDCEKYREEGMTDIVITFPEEGTGYEIGAVSLVKNAPHTDSGKAFIDFAITKKGQEVGQTVNQWQIPVNPEATLDEHMVDLDSVKLISKDLRMAGELRSEMISRFDSEIAPAPKE